MYGVTQVGGGLHGPGALFSLTPGSGGYRYANLAAFPPAHDSNGPVSGPSLGRNGALFVSTQSTLLGYRTGTLKALYAFPPLGPVSNPSSQLLIPAHGTTAYGVAGYGGTISCKQTTGADGCGDIVSFDLTR